MVCIMSSNEYYYCCCMGMPGPVRNKKYYSRQVGEGVDTRDQSFAQNTALSDEPLSWEVKMMDKSIYYVGNGGWGGGGRGARRYLRAL